MKRVAIFISGLMVFSTGHTNAAAVPLLKTKAAPIIGKTKASRLLSSIPVKKSNTSKKTADNKLQRQFNLVSNYLFRGISQTNNLPAAQGGLSYSPFTTGLYISAWGSNVNFDDNHGNTAFLEIDPAIGIANSINEDINYAVSVSRYAYPSTTNSSYNEFNAYLNYSIVTTHFAYSNDVFASGASGTYYNLGLNYPIPSNYIFNIDDIHLTANIGYSELPKNKGLRSYQDYSITMTKTIKNFACSIQWTDTNAQSTDLASLKGSLFSVTIGQSF